MLAASGGRAEPAYLLTGSDRPKIERALRRLRERFAEDGIERLSARDATGDDAGVRDS